MKGFIRVMKALSDPNRVKIIKMLQKRPLCVCEMQAALRIAQPTVSKHLSVLDSAGLVAAQKVGQWVIYSINSEDNVFASSLLESLGTWLDDEPEIAQLLQELEGISRENLCSTKKSRTGDQ